MKKFYTKLSRPNWRITVPNISNSIFNKTEIKEEIVDIDNEKSIEERVENLKNSGSYDLVEEQKKMDNKKSKESLTILSSEVQNGNKANDSDEESRYEDASPMLEKKIDFTAQNYDDANIYADVENIKTPSEKSDTSSLSYEYDIPRISFSFFDESLLKAESEMEVKPISTQQKRKSEIKIILAQPPLIEEEEECDVKMANEVNKQTNDTPVKIINESNDSKQASLDDISILATRCEIELEPKIIEMNLCQSLDELSIGKLSKCDSEPSIDIRFRELNDDSDEEGLYKVPRSHKRLSQSLSNFKDIQTQPEHPPIDSVADFTSIQPEPTSNVIVHDVVLNKMASSDLETCSNLDYIDARSKLPAKIRRATLLRKPHMRIKPQDTWSSFRTKFSNIIATHSAAQRVGANTSGEKILNLEDFYKHSKKKCSKLYSNTSKIFNKKK